MTPQDPAGRRPAPPLSTAELVRVARTLAEAEPLWASLADRLAPDGTARVAGSRDWEAWLEAAADDVVRLEVRALRPRPGHDRRAVTRWRRHADGLTRLTDDPSLEEIAS